MKIRQNYLEIIRVLPFARSGRQTLYGLAPKAEALAAHSIDGLRPHASVLFRFRRRLATAAVLVLTAWLFVHIMFGANGMVVYRQKRTEYQSLQKQLLELQKENDHYTSQIKGLKTDPKLIEKIAREQFHYTKPGEYVLVKPTKIESSQYEVHAAQK